MPQCEKCGKCESNKYYYENQVDFFSFERRGSFFGAFVCDYCWEVVRGSEASLLPQYIPTESEFKEEKQKLMKYLESVRQQGLQEIIQAKVEEKKKEQEVLKVKVEKKLGNQAHLLEILLEKQEDFDLVLFENVERRSRTFLRAQEKLQEVKDKLVSKLSLEEIEKICQTQTEMSELEIASKGRSKEFVERIETAIGQIQILEPKCKNLAKAVNHWKKISANQKTSYEEKLTRKQTYIEELEIEKATNYENFMDEYGKTMEDFYKRQGINTGDYKEHLQDYIFSKQLQAENKQLKEQIKQMKKQLEVKVEIPPKQK